MYSAGPVSLAVETRRYFITQTVIGAAIVNALINAGFGWLGMLTIDRLPMWGSPSIVVDTIMTAFGVAFGTVLVVTFQARKDYFKGKADPQLPTGWLGRLLAILPEGLFARALWLGLACVVLFVPGPIAWLIRAGVRDFGASDFIGFKAAFSAVVGALVTPLISLYAMISARGRPI